MSCPWPPLRVVLRSPNSRPSPRTLVFLLATALAAARPAAGANLGIFSGHADVGGPKLPGSATFDATAGSYTVVGGGANMWFTNDALHFVWKQVSGDVTLAADIAFPGSGGNAHRKACLLVRQSLDGNAAYADAAVHGDGLTSLQYRESAGAQTREIQSNASRPRRVRLEKRGRYVALSVQGPGDTGLVPAGGTFRLELRDPFYVGLGVCAHDDNARETAVFSRVELKEGPLPTSAKPMLVSTLETITIASKDRRVVWWSTNRIEAPNWSRDGAQLLVNRQGRLLRVPVAGGTPETLDTGFAVRCNNDHGFSPDGTSIALSDQSQPDRQSRVYTVPATGGIPRLVTERAPSYWHGWSPDGTTLVYCAQRDGEYDVYSIPVGGGPETRLTDAKGLDDGPEYSPDGRHIYFNSDRTGRMQIWRMKPDGSEQTPVVADEWNNWFPHPSPDGRWIAFLSYGPDVKGHPENQDVVLRLLSLRDGSIETIAKLFGGQGTLNVPSWSPDSRRLAFVSYQFVH